MNEIVLTDEARDWYRGLDEEQADLVERAIDRLAANPLGLGYPYASGIPGSRHGLRELRVLSVRHPIRMFYGFDPRRDAVVLLGASKKGAHAEAKWTKKMVAKAEALFDRYLAEQAAGLHDREE